MDPHRNDKFMHSGPEFHNTRDLFGNKLEIGDEVYYLPSRKGPECTAIAKGKVTHFTKWKIGVDGIAREFHRIAKINVKYSST